MNEADTNFLKHRATPFGMSSLSGKVLEVGLGWGHIANELTSRPDFVTLHSYELDLGLINDFVKKTPAHTILNKDFITDNAQSKFDVGIVDVFDGHSPQVMANARAIVDKMATRINKGGRIYIEYQTNSEDMIKFKQDMELKFGEIQLEFFPHKARGPSTGLTYYVV